MNASQYLISQIKKIIEAHSNLCVRFEFDELARTFVVQVIPYSFTIENKEYQDLEDQINIDFITKYPAFNIYFTDDETSVGIKRIDYELKGSLYPLIESLSFVNRISPVQQFRSVIISEYNQSSVKPELKTTAFMVPCVSPYEMSLDEVNQSQEQLNMAA